MVSTLAERNSLFLRYSYEPFRPVSPESGWRGRLVMPLPAARRWVLARFSRRNRKTAMRVWGPAAVYGIADSGKVDVEVLRGLIGLVEGDVCEIITHPSHGDETPDKRLCVADRHFMKSPDRKREHAALVDPSSREVVDRNGIQLMTYRQAASAESQSSEFRSRAPATG